ncbi:MAG: DUF3616 domain-containing protein [Methylococcaceae bacterium]
MKRIIFSVDRTLEHQGVCDASAAIALDEQHFVVANDEENVLKVYQSDSSGGSVSEISGRDINSYFDNNSKNKEVDIEAAVQLDGIIYWITSHGRNKKGKLRPERHQFFANKISIDNGNNTFKQVGHSYTKLFVDMSKDERLKQYQLEAAEKLPPNAKGGLNIEGLAVTPDKEILIGFRNPVHQGKAILLPLTNPKELLKEKNANAVFGDPIELDLNGLGIRSIEYWESYNRFIIIAGAYDGSAQFSLFQWSGLKDENPEQVEVTGLPSDFRPESVLFYPNRDNQFQLLSDDGSLERKAGTPCKDIKDKDHPQKYFRSLWIRTDDA